MIRAVISAVISAVTTVVIINVTTILIATAAPVESWSSSDLLTIAPAYVYAI